MPTRKPTPTRTQPSKSASANMNAAIKARSKPMTAAQQKASTGTSKVTPGNKNNPVTKYDQMKTVENRVNREIKTADSRIRRANGGIDFMKEKAAKSKAAKATARTNSIKKNAR